MKFSLYLTVMIFIGAPCLLGIPMAAIGFALVWDLSLPSRVGGVLTCAVAFYCVTWMMTKFFAFCTRDN